VMRDLFDAGAQLWRAIYSWARRLPQWVSPPRSARGLHK
jgi:hypothetical protein